MFNHDPSINNFKNSHSRTYYWGVAIAVVLLVGLTYQKTTQAIYRLAISPPGEILNVQGIDTHLYCVGRGSPTVVLQAGAVSFAQSWAWVQQELANTTRVCSYDRPGLGWSDAGDDDLSGTELAHHLHELLQQAGEPGPYVLVGHSMGGPLVQIFTGLYPEHVIAVGLVDPTHPNLLAIYPDQAIPQKRGFTPIDTRKLSARLHGHCQSL